MSAARPGAVRRALDRATRPPVLTVFAVLNLAASAYVAARHLARIDGPRAPSGRIVTGDFYAFHTGATFVRRGWGESLYDLRAQARYQLEGIAPEGSAAGREAPPTPTEAPSTPEAGAPVTEWQAYVNPPLMAVALAPLATLPYRTAYIAFALAMLLALLAALWLLGRRLPGLAGDPWAWATACLLAASWLPVFRTMTGGQNSVLTLFLLTGVFWAWRGRRAVAAGVFLGLLTYKPQYALLAGLVFLLRGELRTVAAAAAVGGAHYAVGAVAVAPDWPLRMLRALREWGTLEAANYWSHFSLPRALGYSLPDAVAWPLTALAVAAVVWLVARRGRRVDPADPRFPAFFALLVTGTLLASPHLQYYDAAILVLPALLLIETTLGRGRGPGLPARLALAAGFLLYPVYQLGDDLGFQPLVAWPIALMAWSWNLSRGGGSTDTEASRFAG